MATTLRYTVSNHPSRIGAHALVARQVTECIDWVRARREVQCAKFGTVNTGVTRFTRDRVCICHGELTAPVLPVLAACDICSGTLEPESKWRIPATMIALPERSSRAALGCTRINLAQSSIHGTR
jgi:hypothetical protein